MATSKTKTEEISDDLNPEYMFQLFDSKLLIDIASGRLDAKEFAANEMTNRGLDKYGKWVGFGRAAQVWGVKI